jgi:hypothetical protein
MTKDCLREILNNKNFVRFTSLIIIFSLAVFSTNFLFGFTNFANQQPMIPVAHAANVNLFVSAENSQFDNYISGPQVIEVIVSDVDINDVITAKGEPDVTVNGKTLRMVQADDGNWYGYFADIQMAQIADQTSFLAGIPGMGLDFGTFCDNSSAGLRGGGSLVFSAPESVGLAVPGDVTGGVQGTTTIKGSTTCSGVTANTLGTPHINVVRQAKQINQKLANTGQINVDVDAWPFIQLYDLNPSGKVVIQYNKGGGAQTTTLTFDKVDQFAKASLDRFAYTTGSDVHVTITDSWLNIDPTDEDSWTFGTVGTPSTNYQVFDKNGGNLGDVTSNIGAISLDNLSDLMCGNNCVLRVNPNVQNKPVDVITLQDNGDDNIIHGDTSTQNPYEWKTLGGNLLGQLPITLTEQGSNSGIFGTYDELNRSDIKITADAARGTSASLNYNNIPVTILVGFNFATIDIKPIDAEWSSGEEIPISLVDGDANRNSKVKEHLDLFNPNVDLIPSLRTGIPNTLVGLTGVTLDGFNVPFTVQKFSDRALLVTETRATITPGDTLSLSFGTMADVFKSTPINKANFHGFALFNYDVRALKNTGNLEGITSVDITLSGVPTFTTQALQGLILLPPTFVAGSTVPIPGTFGANAATVPLTATFTINGAVGDSIPAGTTLPIVADVFGFGFTNDGRENNERISNQIIRLELEETGGNTSTFNGTLEYTMINQLNILNPVTYTTLVPISNETSFIVMDDLDNEGDSPLVTYNDLGVDGTVVQVSDQEVVKTHLGIAEFDKKTYNIDDTVTITLEDLDLNVHNDLVDIYTVVTIPTDANFDVVGDKTVTNGGTSIALSTGDQLGRLLDVTFDDLQWKTPAATSSCLAPLVTLVGTNTGLGGTGLFSLVETTGSSGIFTGDFKFPKAWCRPGATAPESVTDLDMLVNYVDFRDASGDIIDIPHGDGKKYELPLVSGYFTPPRGFQITSIIGNKTSTETKNFFFLQATHYLDSAEIKNLENQGITLVDFLPGFAYVASANSTSLNAFPFNSLPEFRSAFPIEPQTKLDSNVKSKDIPPWVFHSSSPGVDDKTVFTVSFFGPISPKKMEKIITDYGGTVGSTIEGISAVSALMSFDQVTALSTHSGIKFITYQDPPLEPEIAKAKKTANIMSPPVGQVGLSGEGVFALVVDTCKVEHKDLGTRVFLVNHYCPPLVNSPIVDHAFHVTGILGADGGVAPKVKILSFGLENPSKKEFWFNESGHLDTVLGKSKEILPVGDRIDLMNLSLGQIVNLKGWDCKILGNYTATSILLDQFVTGYQDSGGPYEKIIITESAGNERDPYHCNDDRRSEVRFNTISSPATAKNPIVVGSIDSDLYPASLDPISSFSSFGPTDDGRIKPDLVAPGAHNTAEGINSTASNDGYLQMSGTSMAAPLVGGIVALMEQGWEQKTPNNSFEPHLFPHTAKAILIHTAKDLGNPGPDYKYGWGLVDGKKAIDLIVDSTLVDGPTEITRFPMIIHDSISDSRMSKVYSMKLTEPAVIKLTLVWDDPPGSEYDPKLMNDLDLSITNSTKTVYPFVLDKTDPSATAKLGIDSTNNVEMIKTLQRENLKISVVATKSWSGSEQDFTLIVSKDQCKTLQKEIPCWIKNNAGWWAENKIGDNDFVGGIKYLIENGIMKIPSTSQGEGSASNKIPPWIKNNAGWWAVDSITDNDFVDGIKYLIENGIMKINS